MSTNHRSLFMTSRITTSIIIRPFRLIPYLFGFVLLTLISILFITRVHALAVGQALLDIGARTRKPTQSRTVGTPRSWLEPIRVALGAPFAICALALWGFSLHLVHVRQMTDLGLVSVLPISCFIALAALTVGFCMALCAFERVRPLVLLLYVLALIFMLYAMPTLVEEAPRFQVTYWLAGHTEYILRNGSVDPFLDAYFNWPGFFVLTGLLTKMGGLQSVLQLASWASFVYNLLYLAPMYLIFTTATRDRRIVWLGLWFFYITDWVWQDYFAPQGLNFFLYLVIIAIILKWFNTTPTKRVNTVPLRVMLKRPFSLRWRNVLAINDKQMQRLMARGTKVKGIRPLETLKQRGDFRRLVQRLAHRVYTWAALSDAPTTPEQRRQRIALLVIIIALFALSVFSHPLTPMFLLLSVTALTFFRRSSPRWLPILMALMIVGWDFTVAAPYIGGHLRADIAQIGNLRLATSSNVTDRLSAGSPEHQFIAQARVVETAAIWGLAFLGAVLRWRRGAVQHSGNSPQATESQFSHDVPLTLLVVAPAVMVVLQPYGGEMAMRFVLFSLPILSYFAATFFFTLAPGNLLSRFKGARVAVVLLTCLVLLGGFLFARYGNERADYVTYNESQAVAYLYSIAPPHSLLLQGWTGTPWRYKDLEKYDYFPLYPGYGDAAALRARFIGGIVNRASSSKYPAAYVIFTRSQMAQAQMFYGVPPSALRGVEQALLQSGKFVLVYSNADTDILVYVRPQHANTPASNQSSTVPIHIRQSRYTGGELSS